MDFRFRSLAIMAALVGSMAAFADGGAAPAPAPQQPPPPRATAPPPPQQNCGQCCDNRCDDGGYLPEDQYACGGGPDCQPYNFGPGIVINPFFFCVGPGCGRIVRPMPRYYGGYGGGYYAPPRRGYYAPPQVAPYMGGFRGGYRGGGFRHMSAQGCEVQTWNNGLSVVLDSEGEVRFYTHKGVDLAEKIKVKYENSPTLGFCSGVQTQPQAQDI